MPREACVKFPSGSPSQGEEMDHSMGRRAMRTEVTALPPAAIAGPPNHSGAFLDLGRGGVRCADQRPDVTEVGLRRSAIPSSATKRCCSQALSLVCGVLLCLLLFFVQHGQHSTVCCEPHAGRRRLSHASMFFQVLSSFSPGRNDRPAHYLPASRLYLVMGEGIYF